MNNALNLLGGDFVKDFAFILISHGNFAKEALEAVQMIAGKQENCGTVSVLPGKDLEGVSQEVEELYQSLNRDMGVVIYCDIFGGTPSNVAAKLLLQHANDNIFVMTGFNLPVVLETVMNRSKTIEQIKDYVMGFMDKTYCCLNDLNNSNEEVEDL